ncbi:MAG: hypothetical protein JF618_08705 [Leifsonia sp.]|nr:hypothetical protein [Leifsonia sp.]
MEHSWVSHPARVKNGEPVARRRFVLSDWLPAAILARGGQINRETDRALGDLRAAQSARETGR